MKQKVVIHIQSMVGALLLLLSSNVSGQIAPKQTTINSGNTSTYNQNRPIFSDSTFESADSLIIPDTFICKYYSQFFFRDSIEIRDTSLQQFEKYDPNEQQEFLYSNLGNIGSSATPLVYLPQNYTTFSLGLNAYKNYEITPQNMRFFKTNRLFTDLFFMQIAGNQENFVAKADLAQSFANDVNVSLNYQRCNHIGYYTNQYTKHTNFGLGINYKLWHKKIEAFATFYSNAFNEKHNGGVTDLNQLTQPFKSIRLNVDVNLAGAENRLAKRGFSHLIYAPFWGGVGKKNAMMLFHMLQVEDTKYRFSDADVSTDSIHYAPYFVESRGIRSILQNLNIANDVGFLLNTTYFNGRVGIRHDYFRYNNEIEARKRHDLTLHGDGKLALTKRFVLDVEGQIGVGANAGSFQLSGKTVLQIFPKYLSISAKTSFFRSEIPLIDREVTVIDQKFESGIGVKPFGNVTNISVSIPKIGLTVSVDQSTVNKPIYGGTNGVMEQYDNVYTNSRISAQHTLKLWRFGLENGAVLQRQNTSIYAMPDWYTSHKVYIDFSLFKKAMDVRFGANGHLFDSYTLPGFRPIYNQFYQSTTAYANKPQVDLFLLTKVDRFRAFFIVENFTDIFNQNSLLFVNNYPQFDWTFRFGFRWQLLD